MNRRGFLKACLAACAAPAIVRADSLMRVVPNDTLIITNEGMAYASDPVVTLIDSDLIALIEKRIADAGALLVANFSAELYDPLFFKPGRNEIESVLNHSAPSEVIDRRLHFVRRR